MRQSDKKYGGSAARKEQILAQVRRKGYATIEELATQFPVSSQTIRRDLIELANNNLVQRYHGGAGLPQGGGDLAYATRKIRNADAKRDIARLVAAHIPDGASLFVDIGTTTEAVAAALIGHKGLRVITNHMSVASILSDSTDFEIILAGGLVRNRDRAITGEATCDFLRRFKVSIGVFGIGAIDQDGELLDYDYRDMQVSTTAMAISRRRFVAMDHGKFNGEAMIRLGHVADIDALFTDAPPPPGIAAVMRQHRLQVIVPQRQEEEDVGPDSEGRTAPGQTAVGRRHTGKGR